MYQVGLAFSFFRQASSLSNSIPQLLGSRPRSEDQGRQDQVQTDLRQRHPCRHPSQGGI